MRKNHTDNPYPIENEALRSLADYKAANTTKSVIQPEPPRREAVQEVFAEVKIEPSSKVKPSLKPKARQRSKKQNFIIQHEDLSELAGQLGISETAVVNTGIALVKKYLCR